ncbi:MAG: 30S ribosomal protein S4 [Candidatus Woykebacteria bacterium RIFCSPHIGHO2_12_FULL_43_10]|uniref:Small ribosomal subunit protein uS4 n=2 Tax=Candidatus Woykeibacteriota TaxID=1817899 RepID=A0A1G1WXH4_9BACT|nr:MAG: 30S ribosomal protein S4 [Candidatus Woykebacteria bacterium RIFCSPHIGHO2_01_FULL_43_29]OGY28719.1 MAG: 30S ribosomal protein S4 [Candidatus Woykebacteria bacterium RIFCSPHIGHO2_02_FULL_43_16b]OGY29794.1 MAG: 30S ribosomal protein S4 [Candidatus Woykebacteria bacterium RIFCSPHIGHO2_12_FULL_43_10]OGY32468.1 MAG: 30S ribosomal protein S4 [Candidatus Woykebacteria bacterium RIFCSPLOWO2_01_FULL_43_14]
MARYTGPKFRLDRREGVNLFLKGERSLGPKHPLERKGAVPPGQHGQKNTHKKVSDYGQQLREKQKVKRMYGILEKQFKNYFTLAAKKKGSTGETLLQLLESRLDNVVYRLGLAASRNQARQFVTHGHVLVEGEKLDIPSYRVKVGEVVSIKGKMTHLLPPLDKNAKISEWLEKKALAGKLSRMPQREELDPTINEQLIVEYYSR